MRNAHGRNADGQIDGGRASLLHATKFETFEDRLALSGQALDDCEVDTRPIEPHYGELAPALNDAHDLTGARGVETQFGFTGRGQTVAVIDSGIAFSHVALGGGFGANHRVVGGWDFAENDANPYDDGPAGFHGTHVAGILGSSDGVYRGVAPGVDLVALRVFDDNGGGYFQWVEQSLQWVHQNRNAFEHPITTVNLSLGTAWNSGELPDWATLEDELSQLKSDGIFVAVSAGNAFQQYQSPGLSYPAASPAVVPVASVDNDGTLSSFSQRHDRVLAAPGRSITSTVPDHVYGADGVANDFGAASGTSMAAPYVAGASVLVRQAFAFTGRENVSPDEIASHLRQTSDLVYDSVTNASYHRLNVGRAIDSLMPADDVGSTPAAARSLGQVVDTLSQSGTIGRVGDVDFFRFTATGTGTIRVAATGSADFAARWDLAGGSGRVDAQGALLDVVAGQTYTVGLSSANLGHYRVQVQADYDAPATTELGTVDFRRIDGVRFDGRDTWYAFRATRDGQLTFDAQFAHAAGNVDLELYDAQKNLVSASRGTSDGERLDVTARAGDAFFVKVVGTNADVDLRLANLVQQSGNQVTVFGTGGDDSFRFKAGGSPAVEINGLTYQLTTGTGAGTSGTSVVRFDGGAGRDTVQLIGTDQADNAYLRAESSQMRGTGYDVTAIGESVTVFGGGGNDRAYLYDSAGDDTFVATPTEARLSGTGFDNRAVDFDRVFGQALGGGRDTAELHDSAENDRLVARPELVTMSGRTFNNSVRGFDRVVAFASSGQDRALLYDSTGDDRFEARPNSATLSGSGFEHVANGFDRVFAYASTGQDEASLYDSAGNDRFIARPTYATLSGDGFYNHAESFDRVAAFASNGDDWAYLYGSEGDDTFVARPDSATMSGGRYANTAFGFDRTLANAGAGGTDRARLTGSTGTDRLVVSAASTTLAGTGFQHVVRGFADVNVAGNGGVDQAVFRDIGEGDTFYGRGKLAGLRGSTDLAALDFERVAAHARRGETAQAELGALDFFFEKVGEWK